MWCGQSTGVLCDVRSKIQRTIKHASKFQVSKIHCQALRRATASGWNPSLSVRAQIRYCVRCCYDRGIDVWGQGWIILFRHWMMTYSRKLHAGVLQRRGITTCRIAVTGPSGYNSRLHGHLSQQPTAADAAPAASAAVGCWLLVGGSTCDKPFHVRIDVHAGVRWAVRHAAGARLGEPRHRYGSPGYWPVPPAECRIPADHTPLTPTYAPTGCPGHTSHLLQANK